MTDRPILFSGPMVRAVLDGRKSQTRRVVKSELGGRGEAVTSKHGVLYWRLSEKDPRRWCGCDGLGSLGWLHCPYGGPGGRLWVRETFALLDPDLCPDGMYPIAEGQGAIAYRADTGDRYPGGWPHEERDHPECGRWRPSIHMPRWASRITLEVTDVRVDRVQDITNEGARAEGIPQTAAEAHALGLVDSDLPGHLWDNATSAEHFHRLWDTINAKRGFGWDVNPWVWVVSFRVVGG